MPLPDSFWESEPTPEPQSPWQGKEHMDLSRALAKGLSPAAIYKFLAILTREPKGKSDALIRACREVLDATFGKR